MTANLMSTFLQLFDVRVLNAFAAVGLAFLHFAFFKLFQRSDQGRSNFFFYLGCGWIVNLFYLMFLDVLPRLSIDPSLSKVIIRSLNTLTFFLFLFAAKWQVAEDLRRRMTVAASLFAGIALLLSWSSLLLGKYQSVLYLPGIALAPLSVAAVGFNYHRHFHLSRESFAAGTKIVLVSSVYLYALLQCCLFLLPPFTEFFTSKVLYFEEGLFIVGGLLKLGNIVGLILYSQAVVADYQAQKRVIERAHLCVSLSDQLSHEIQTPASELRVRIEAAQSTGVIEGAELEATKRLVNDISNLIEAFEVYQSDQRLDQKSYSAGVVNLNTICDSVVLSVKAIMRPRCRFEKIYDPGPTVLAVQTEISQIVRNLVRNAVESIGRARMVNPGISTVIVQTQTSQSEGRIHLFVRDDGAGIDRQIFHRIFEDGVTTNKGRGRGHGLFITRSLVQKNGGTIEARNIEVKGEIRGAEFHVTLPLVEKSSERGIR